MIILEKKGEVVKPLNVVKFLDRITNIVANIKSKLKHVQREVI